MFKKNLFLFSLTVCAILVFAGCSFNSNDLSNNSNKIAQDNSEIIFFYGEECPHCKIVEEYFSKNNTAEKIQFSQREVYHNKNNAALMVEKAKLCGISEENLGVPMLWTKDKNCFFGDRDIIDFFNKKTNVENAK